MHDGTLIASSVHGSLFEVIIQFLTCLSVNQSGHDQEPYSLTFKIMTVTLSLITCVARETVKEIVSSVQE